MRLFGKKDAKLFELFAASAGMVVKGGDILKSVVHDYRDLNAKMAKLTELEHEGDMIIQELVERLNSSFVLPFDREDAFQLVQKLDATLDYITGIIDRMLLYKAGEPNRAVYEMVEVLWEALQEQEKAFNLLDRLAQNRREVMDCVQKIKSLEKKQDGLYRASVAELFDTEKDAIKIIKWKEVYEHIEMATDYCEDIGDLLGNICVKYT